MCGLFGYVQAGGVEPARGAGALAALAHRGPDQQGDWFDADVYVGHRRLSILDLSERARQPFVSEDGVVVVAVNGEIYNYPELRRELSLRHRMRTEGDSEVVLHGYREWGIRGLLQRIEGMFAFCVYDARAGRVYLARDRVGIKPLYYSTAGKAVAWASELKAIERFLGPSQLRTDPTAAYDFLTYLYVPTPKTLYRDVHKLEPAHYLEVSVRDGKVAAHRYWSLGVETIAVGLPEAAECLRAKIGEAVRSQLCSDVPVGFFLSGGMDSSVVVCEAARASAQVHTYSIGFEDPEHDETAYAARVAERFGTRHDTRILERRHIPSMLERLREWFDEPFADTSAFPSYLVSQFARETCKVVLTGDGGDEVFGGYSWYGRFHRHKDDAALVPRRLLPALARIRRRYRRTLAGRLANRLELGALDELELHARLLGGLLKDEKRAYAAELGIAADYDDYWHFRRHYRPGLPTHTRLQVLDFHTYLPDDILTKVDRVSMAVSLEARVPLLATDVVEYAFSLPEDVRLPGGREKGLLKAAYAGLLPAETLDRPKRGFSIPARTYVPEIASAGETRQEVILDRLFGAALRAA
jgi:asparagine synthase (glutamine-hydrolysing)